MLLVSFSHWVCELEWSLPVDSAGTGNDLCTDALLRYRPAQDFIGRAGIGSGLNDDAITGGNDGDQDGAGL